MSAMLEKVEGAGPERYFAPALEKIGFRVFITGRGGGASQGPYSSLNVSLDVGDTAAHVNENLDRIRKAEGIKDLWRARQVHGDHVLGISQWPPSRMEDADALVVAVKGITAGVTVADCLPAVLMDPVKKAAAVIHAGRKGTELHIVRKTLFRMSSWFQCDPKDIVALFGPCIRTCCYQVDEKTAEAFRSCCGGSGRMLDIAGANRDQLASSGVPQENILDCGICTSCQKERFFSHRGHNGVTGRFLCGVTVLS